MGIVERALLSLALLGAVGGIGLLLRRWSEGRARARTGQAAADLDLPPGPLLLYFYGQVCSQCVLQKAILERLRERFPQVRIHPVDVADRPDLARPFGVWTLPSLVLLDEAHRVRWVRYGLARETELIPRLEAVAGVDAEPEPSRP